MIYIVKKNTLTLNSRKNKFPKVQKLTEQSTVAHKVEEFIRFFTAHCLWLKF